MTTTDLFILLGGGLLLVVIALVLWGWRRSAVQSVLPPDKPAASRPAGEEADAMAPIVRAELLGLIIQRGSKPHHARETPVTPEVVTEARALLSRRRKIEAIKLVREHTGWGLKESKDFVDGLH